MKINYVIYTTGAELRAAREGYSRESLCNRKFTRLGVIAISGEAPGSSEVEQEENRERVAMQTMAKIMGLKTVASVGY